MQLKRKLELLSCYNVKRRRGHNPKREHKIIDRGVPEAKASEEHVVVKGEA